jgi:hypothetical protein
MTPPGSGFDERVVVIEHEAFRNQSRGLTLRLDTTHMTASVVLQDEHRPGLLAFYEGNLQPQYNGDSFVGWGQWPYFTEFNARRATVFDARFVGANSSYRAFRFRWTGTPAIHPGVATRVSGATTTVYASWNGSTLLSKWRILTGAAPNSLKTAATASKQAFETSIPIQHAGAYVAAQALDDHRRVLATSLPLKVP